MDQLFMQKSDGNNHIDFRISPIGSLSISLAKNMPAYIGRDDFYEVFARIKAFYEELDMQERIFLLLTEGGEDSDAFLGELARSVHWSNGVTAFGKYLVQKLKLDSESDNCILSIIDTERKTTVSYEFGDDGWMLWDKSYG